MNIPSSQKKYLIQESVLFLLLSYLVLLGGMFNGLVIYELNLINLILLILIGFIWFGWRLLASPDFPGTYLDIPLYLFLGIYILATIFSIDPRRSLNFLAQMLIACLTFYLVVDLIRSGWPISLFTKVLLLISGFILFFGLRELFMWYARWVEISNFDSLIPPVTYRLRAFLGHPNFVAAYFNILLPLGIAGALKARLKFTRIVLVLWIGLAFVCVYFTSSRGGWLGTAVALGVFGGLWLLSYKKVVLEYYDRIRLRKDWLIAGGIFTIFSSISLFLLLKWQSQHPSHPSGWRNIFQSRDYIWKVAWEALRENWLLGNGPFTFGTEYIQHYSSPPTMLLAHAHNYFLNTAFESGLIGLLGLLIFLVFLIVLSWRVWRNPNRLARIELIGILASLAGLAAHSLFETPQMAPLFLILSSILVALLAAEAIPPWTFAKQGLKETGLIFLWLTVIIGFGWSVRAYKPFTKGINASHQEQWEIASNYMDEAVEVDKWNALFWLQDGLAHGQAALDDQGNVIDINELDQAIKAYEQGISLEPAYAVNWLNLGILHWAAGDYQGSLKALENAAEKAPKFAEASLTLGNHYEDLGYLIQAQKSYETVLTLKPYWVYSYYFRETSFRKEVAGQWLDNNVDALFPEDEKLAKGWKALENNRIENAKELFESAKGINTPRAYYGLGVALMELGEYDKAEQSLQTALFSHSSDGWLTVKLYLALGSLEQKRGNYRDAVQAYDQALMLLERSSSAGIGTLGITEYSWYVFNRSSIAVDLLPGVVHIYYTDQVVEGMLDLADCYQALNDKNAAEQTYEKILDIAPDNVIASQFLGE